MKNVTVLHSAMRISHLMLLLCVIWPAAAAPVKLVGAANRSVPVTSDRELRYTLSQWTTEDGLPQNTVTRLLQTRDGYLWIGTRAGLARFDGVKFTVFMRELQIEDSDALSCEQMSEDGDGALWIRLPAVLVRYKDGHFKKYSLAGHRSNAESDIAVLEPAVQGMIASRRGGFWACTREGLKRFENGRYTRTYAIADGLATGRIGLLREDHFGRLWIGWNWPGSGAIRSYRRLDPQTGEVIEPPNPPNARGSDLGNLSVDQSGQVWLSDGRQLCRWDETRWTCFSMPPGVQRDGGHELKEDTFGALWFAPDFTGKLVRFHNERFDVFSVEDGLADTDIRVVLPDREGNIWLGTGSAGLQQLRRQGLLTLFGTKPDNSRRSIFSVSAEADGTMWFATGSSLLCWKDSTSTRFTNGPPWTPGNAVHAVLADRRGQVWLACREQGLFTLFNVAITRVSAADLGRTDYVVTGLHEDRVGTLWVSTSEGLLERRGVQFFRYGLEHGLSDKNINGVLDAPDGSLWVGTISGGINHFKDGRFRAYTMREGLLSNRAMPLRVEEDGTVWVGTDERGLNRIRDDKVGAVTQKQGLFDNFVYSLLDDGAGRYWAHSNRGIFRVDKADLHAVADGRLAELQCVHYGGADGMASVEANGDYQPSASRAPDGRFWFPTTRGVVVLDPITLAAAEVPPLVQIQQVKADGEVIYGDGLELSSSATRPEHVKLSAGHGRILEFHYTANSLADAERVRFRYRLNGYEQDWREITSERVAHYPDVGPGPYYFQVEAANAHGLWSTSPARLSVFIAPHFYQTWTFYVLCGATMLAGGFGLHYRRVRFLRRIERLEREQALQAERARIARDLHDDLGANLTGIALKADLAQRQLNGQGSCNSPLRDLKIEEKPEADVAGELASIAASTRALVDNMRETVWALNPRHDTLESLARFLAEHAEEFASSAGLRCRLELPDRLPSLTIPSPVRYDIHMVVKEALHNAVKHAGAREVHFSLQMEGGDLCLRIADDGQGFDPENGKHSTNNLQGSCFNGQRGNGLSNMRQRIERMNGRWDLQTRAGQGTCIGIRIPTSSFRNDGDEH